jgi:DNA damage-binding protein 1
MSSNTANVIVAKSRRLEVRQASPDPSSPFPLVLTLPINGRITSMVPLKLPRTPTDYLFITTDRYRYAVISYSPENTPYPCQTHASGSLKGMGRESAVGPLVAVDPHGRCLCLHLYDGLITVIPIHVDYVPGTKQPYPGYHLLGEPYQLRLEERAILDLLFLHTSLEKQPHVCLLHQDAHSAQHVITYTMDIKKKQLVVAWKKGRVDGGSSMLLAVPSVTAAASSSSPQNNNNNAGVVVVGQRQITFLNTGISKVVPLPFCLVVSATYLAHGRFLLGDEFGNLHILTIHQKSNGIEMETLGSCVISTSLAHVQDGLVYVASQFGDSQLVQIHQEPLQLQTDNELGDASTSFLEIIEEYTNLGPIVDFDLVPTHGQQQSQVVTCSGSSTSGSIRLIRNGIGMNECASVEMEGIQNLWSIRNDWSNVEDAYLVQSFVGETRVLGVSSSSSANNNAMEQQDDNDNDDDEGGGTLEEVILEGLDSTASSLHVGNVQVGNSILQITESEIRLMSASSTSSTTQVLTATWSPEGAGQSITVASANEAGQIVISLRGGVLLYLRVVEASTIELVAKTTLEREVSCVDLHPFVVAESGSDMMVDMAPFSNLVAVGLWDDFTVRLLSLDSDLNEVLNVNLGMEDEEEADYTDGVARRTRANMMARSLCLITLDSANTTSSSSSGNSVDMLFVGLGDGTLISFAVLERDGRIGVHSRKEVSLGTQRINLVPLQTDQGGRCVLATGDRPTVIYLAGGGAGGGATAVNFSNPKLCYSNVNLSASDTGEDDDVNRPPAQQIIAVNVATPFVSPQLFDTTSVGSKQFCLCVSDDSNLRLGIIDDIQKLHVTTCRLGMAPRRVVHCSQDRMFAVGCIESGLKQGGSARDDVNMGNCIRFLDDTTFDDIER